MKIGSFIGAAVLLAAVTACSDKMSEAELLARSQQALEAGDYSAAVIDAKGALQQNPANAAGRFILGRAYLAQLNPAAAATELERALRAGQDPETLGWYARALLESGQRQKLLDYELPVGVTWDARGRAALARAHLSDGDVDAAMDYLDPEAAQTAEDAFVATTAVMLGYAQDQDGVAAVDQLRVIADQHPDAVATQSLLVNMLLTQGDRDAAIAALEEITKASPQRLQERLQLIALLTERNDLDEADRKLGELEKAAPDNLGVKLARGRLQVINGDYEEAVQSLADVLSANPRHLQSLYFSGIANVELSNLATGSRQLRQYLESGTENAIARQQLARAELGLGNPKDAEAIIRKVLEEEPMNIKAIGLLGLALAAQGSSLESVAAFEEMVSLAPESVEARLGAASQQSAAGNTQAALEQLRAALSLAPENDRIREQLILTLAQSGRFSEARSEVDAYLELRGEAVAPLLAAAGVELISRQAEPARAYLNRILELDPANLNARRALATLLSMEGDSAGARSAFEAILEDYPDNLEVLSNLAVLAEQRQDYAAMSAFLRRAVESAPDAVVPRVSLAKYEISQQRFSEAVDLLEPLQATQQGKAPPVRRLLAVAYRGVGRAQESVNIAEDLIRASPDDLGLLLLLTEQEQALGDLDSALGYIERAIELEPDTLLLQGQRLELLVQKGDIAGSSKALSALPDEVQQRPEMIKLAGRIAVAEQRFADAEALFERAMAAEPSSGNLLAVVGLQWRDGRRDEAFDGLRAWLSENPDDVPVRFDLASRLLATGQEAEAAAEYTTVVEAQPDSVVALNNLAWLLRETDSDAALAYIDRALALAPNDPSMLDTKAMVQLASGAEASALISIDQALEAAPGAGSVRFNRAKILVAMGREAEAAAVLDELLVTGDFAEVDEARALRATLR